MLNNVIKDWLEFMKKGKVRFASLQTSTGIYDRVAVLVHNSRGLYIQYPKAHKKGWLIRKETIPANSIRALRYYKD